MEPAYGCNTSDAATSRKGVGIASEIGLNNSHIGTTKTKWLFVQWVNGFCGFSCCENKCFISKQVQQISLFFQTFALVFPGFFCP